MERAARSSSQPIRSSPQNKNAPEMEAFCT